MALRVSSLFTRRLSLNVSVITALVVINALLVAASLFALQQNVKLRAQLNYQLALLTPAKGTFVPPVSGEDWKGRPQALAYESDGRPTLVYMFSVGCGYCQENWHAMRAFQALTPRWLRIVYVDTFEDRFSPKYLIDHGIGDSPLLVHVSSPELSGIFDARAVPQVVLVDREGKVEWSHVGELADGDVSKGLSLIGHD